MLRPAFVNIVRYFYPLGNTPAVCLTQDLPREEAANVLLLGCGDVQNILFTTYADNGSSESSSYTMLALTCSESRRVDITCCDNESAILGMISLATKWSN